MSYVDNFFEGPGYGLVDPKRLPERQPKPDSRLKEFCVEALLRAVVSLERLGQAMTPAHERERRYAVAEDQPLPVETPSPAQS